MKTRIIRIGNSRGIRISKSFIEDAGLVKEVEIRVVESGVLIEGAHTPRAGWGETAEALREGGEDGPLDESVPSDVGILEWEWK